MRYRNELTLDGQKILLQTDLSHVSQKTSWDAQRHCHPAFEVHIILSGHCQVEAEQATLSLVAGQCLLIPPGKYHRPLSYSRDFSRFSLIFSPEPILRHNLLRLFPGYTPFSLNTETARFCKEILLESSTENPYKAERTQALVTLLMVELFRQWQVPNKQVTPSLPATDLERFAVIDDFFEKHFADSAGENDLAGLLHLSKRQLARVLDKHYGMTFRQKQLGARMDRAAWLLRSTKETVSHIAGAVGYTSESAFFQVFRKYFGMTPQQYRLQDK
jgi:AraC-like DNA-binding protein